MKSAVTPDMGTSRAMTDPAQTADDLCRLPTDEDLGRLQ